MDFYNLLEADQDALVLCHPETLSNEEKSNERLILEYKLEHDVLVSDSEKHVVFEAGEKFQPYWAEGKFGKTILHIVCHRSCLDVIRALLEIGTDPEVQDYLGRTALHYSILDDSFGGVKILLEAGAIPSVRDKNGATPLDYATEFRHKGIAELLKQYGAR